MYPEETEKLYSPELLDVIRAMLSENTDERPYADYLLKTEFKSVEQRKID